MAFKGYKYQAGHFGDSFIEQVKKRVKKKGRHPLWRRGFPSWSLIKFRFLVLVCYRN